MADGLVKIERPDDPERCQANGLNGGQCLYKHAEGSEYCGLHNGLENAQRRTKELNLYKLKRFSKRIAELKEATGARTLEEELALLRMLLEETINRCETEVELLLYSDRMVDLVVQIRNTVLAAEKLASRTGMLVGRAEALTIAAKCVEIISRHVTDDKQLNAIAADLQGTFLTPVEDSLKDEE
jgi:hypothetical protein